VAISCEELFNIVEIAKEDKCPGSNALVYSMKNTVTNLELKIWYLYLTRP
jgi:hypothetical protein